MQILFQQILKTLVRWKSVNTVLHRQESKALPEYSLLSTLCTLLGTLCTLLGTLCTSFFKYFINKIAHIRLRFVINDNDYDFPERPTSENTLQCFTPAITSEVFIIIKKS